MKIMSNHKMINQLKKIFIIFFIMFFILNSIQASAHSAYYLQITYDEGSYTFSSEILMDNEGSSENVHIETEAGNYLKYIKDNIGGSETPWSEYIAGVDGSSYDVSSTIANLDSAIGEGNERSLYYTFPPIHIVKGFWVKDDNEEDLGLGDDVGNANSKDMDLAYRINDNVVQDFNMLLENIVSTHTKKPDSRKFLVFATELANKAWNVSTGAADSATLTYDLSKLSDDGTGTTTIKLSRVTKASKEWKDVENIAPLEYWSYLKVQINEEDPDLVAAFVDKGYCQHGATEEYNAKAIPSYEHRDNRSKSYRTACATGSKDGGSLAEARDFEWFGWKSIVLQADHLLVTKDMSASNSTELADEDSFGHSFAKQATKVYTGIINVLGLDSMEELMLNRGRIGNRTYMGLFPKTWLPVLNFVNILLQLIVWSLLAFSITRLLFKRSLATMNIGEKINLMEGMKNIIVSAIVMGIWPLFFTMMGRLNYFIVQMFGAISPFSETFSMSMIGFNLLSIVTAFYIFGMTFYFNLMYIIRAITISFLYALAPLFIYTISLGGKTSSYFSIYLKELVGHIYLQSFHALMLSFFSYLTKAGVGTTSQIFGFNHWLVKWVLIYSFIPISNFVRNNIFQMGDGVMNTLAASHQDRLKGGKKYGADEAEREMGATSGGGSKGGGGGGFPGTSDAALAKNKSTLGTINQIKSSSSARPDEGNDANEKKYGDRGSRARKVMNSLQNSPFKSARTVGSIASQAGQLHKMALQKSEQENPGLGGKSRALDVGGKFAGSLAQGAMRAAPGLAATALKSGINTANAQVGVSTGNLKRAEYYSRKAGYAERAGLENAIGDFKQGSSGLYSGSAVDVMNGFDSNSTNGIVRKIGSRLENGGTAYEIDLSHNQNLQEARMIASGVNPDGSIASKKQMKIAQAEVAMHDIAERASKNPEKYAKMGYIWNAKTSTLTDVNDRMLNSDKLAGDAIFARTEAQEAEAAEKAKQQKASGIVDANGNPLSSH